MSNANTVVATNKLVIPIGSNLISEPNRTFYHPLDQLHTILELISCIMVIIPTKYAQGATGPTGPAGPTGPDWAYGTNRYNRRLWKCFLDFSFFSQGIQTIASGGVMPWNLNTVHGGVSFDGTNLVANTAGTYLINFGYGLFLPSSSNNMPQSFSLITGGSTATAVAQYTLQERQDPGPTPQIYFDVAGQSASVVMTLTAGETVNMINSLNGSTVCKFENNVDGAYTINGGIGTV